MFKNRNSHEKIVKMYSFISGMANKWHGQIFDGTRKTIWCVQIYLYVYIYTSTKYQPDLKNLSLNIKQKVFIKQYKLTFL